MLGGAESDPVVVPLVGDTAVLGEVGAGAGRGTRWTRGSRTVFSGEGAPSSDSGGQE